MEKEIWKDVKDYEGLYQVSNLGNVKSLYDASHKKFRELILTPSMAGWGYLRVDLYKYGKKKRCKVHRLVAMAFIPIPEHLKHLPLEKLQINHKDEDKTNNCVWNLEWCDCKYNNNYGTHNKRSAEAHKGMKHTEETKRKMSEARKGEKNPNYGKHRTDETKRKIGDANSKKVLQLNKTTGEVIKQWPSTREVQRQLGYSQSSISQCCLGKLNTCGGFKWKYA